MIESKKKPLTILLASLRGFCAGVDHAILIVERATEDKVVFKPPRSLVA